MDKELDRIFEEYELGADLDEETYEQRAEQVRTQFAQKMSTAASSLRFGQDLIALYRYFTDTNVPWQRKTIIVAALFYFIMPIDAIPDLLPFAGYLDDFGVVAAVTAFMADQLKPYYP